MSSLLWMFIGDASARSVISLFNLTYAGAALGFLALALTGWWRMLLAPAALVAGGLTLWVAEVNLPYSHWYMPSALEAGIALAVAAMPPLLRPVLFDRQRSLRIFALAMIVPLLLCLRGLLSP